MALALTGCATGTGDSPESVEPGSAQNDPGASEPDAPQEQSTASIPEGWPEAIRVVSGPIDDNMFMVTVAAKGDGRAVFDEGVALLEGAGHTMVFLLDDDESSLTGQWKGEGYFVIFDVSHTDGVKFASYTVTTGS